MAEGQASCPMPLVPILLLALHCACLPLLPFVPLCCFSHPYLLSFAATLVLDLPGAWSNWPSQAVALALALTLSLEWGQGWGWSTFSDALHTSLLHAPHCSLLLHDSPAQYTLSLCSFPSVTPVTCALSVHCVPSLCSPQHCTPPSPEISLILGTPLPHAPPIPCTLCLLYEPSWPCPGL